MTDKRSVKRIVTPKRLGAPSAPRPILTEVSQGAAEYCDVETPPSSAAGWTVEIDDKVKEPWAEEDAHKESHDASPIDSIVASPNHPNDTGGAEEESGQDHLLRGVWSHSACEGATHDMPLLLHSQECDAEESEVVAAHRSTAALKTLNATLTPQHAHVEDCDDMMAGVLGHMAEVGELEDMGAHEHEHFNVSNLAWPSQVQHDVQTLDVLLDEAELRAHQHIQQNPDAKEVDEVEWLRRTYETVYNPAARQRALDQLVCLSSPAKRPVSKPQQARPFKSTVIYEYV